MFEALAHTHLAKWVIEPALPARGVVVSDGRFGSAGSAAQLMHLLANCGSTMEVHVKSLRVHCPRPSCPSARTDRWNCPSHSIIARYEPGCQRPVTGEVGRRKCPTSPTRLRPANVANVLMIEKHRTSAQIDCDVRS